MRPSRSTLLPAVVVAGLLGSAGAAATAAPATLAAPATTAAPAGPAPTATTYVVKGDILARYTSLGGSRGFLGRPLTDELTTPDPAGRYSVFEGGSIYWTAATGAWEVHGDIREDWAGLGYEAGRVGFPLTNELSTPNRAGAYNAFQRAAIYWSPETGAAEIEGDIRARWAAIGWEDSPLGFPVYDELDSPLPGGRGSIFEYGVIEWTPQMGALITSLLDYPSAVDKQENRITFASAKQSFTYDNNDKFYRYSDPDPTVEPAEIDLAEFEAGLEPGELLVVDQYLEDRAHDSRFYLVDFPTTSQAAAKSGAKTLLQRQSGRVAR